MLFALTSKLVERIERETGVRLPYCGEFHYNPELWHAMSSDHAELARIELSDAERTEAMR